MHCMYMYMSFCDNSNVVIDVTRECDCLGLDLRCSVSCHATKLDTVYEAVLQALCYRP